MQSKWTPAEFYIGVGKTFWLKDKIWNYTFYIKIYENLGGTWPQCPPPPTPHPPLLPMPMFYVNLWVLMHWYNCKSLLNTLARLRKSCRTVGCVPCQASTSRYQSTSHAKPARSVINEIMSKPFNVICIGHAHSSTHRMQFSPAPSVTRFSRVGWVVRKFLR